MIAVDTNLLVYAHRQDSALHPAAYTAIAGLAQGSNAWAIPWPCIHEFVANVTSPRIYRPPTPLHLALDQVDAGMESPSLALLTESPVHWSILRPMLLDGEVRGPQTHDARIAAICLQHGVGELWTNDRDFRRFPALRSVNPLSAAAGR